MKRTISLIIAIAVMISMFVLPASAAEYIVDMSTLNGASAFTAAVNIPIPGITLSDIGLHFQTGEPGATNGNTVDIPLDLSGYNTMTITYRTGAAVGVECEKLMLQKADYSASYSTFDIKGSGGWGTTAEASIDVSAITEGTTNYRLTLQNNGTGNGLFVTGIKLTTDTTSGGGSVTPPPAGDTVTSLSGIVEGNNVLGADISGTKNISSGTYVIDLAGYKWTGNMLISGTADVTIMDSSAGKTGLIDASQMGDGIEIKGSAKLTLDAVKVIGGTHSGDAVFVKESATVVSNNSILSAGKAGIDVTSASASVTVNGGSFPEFTSGALDERNAAIELRWNAKVTLNGDIDFTVNRIVARKTEDSRDCHTNAIADSIVCGANASATFTAETAVVDPYPYYNVTEITYTYTTAAGDPAFTGASLTLTSGITLNFFAEGVSADDYIMVGDTKVTGVADGANYKFGFSNFGPQQMGDEFTAELYVDDVKVEELTYSVKQYCYDTIATSSSAELVALAKAVLNYGAAAQTYKGYKTNALVNADLPAADQEYNYSPGSPNRTISADITPHYLWKSAKVYFGDTISLVITFAENPDAAEYGVTVVDPAVVKSGVTGMSGVTFDRQHTIEAIEGGYKITVNDILPTEFRDSYLFRMFDAQDNRISNDLVYGVSIYCAVYDYVNVGIEHADLAEPQGPINGLVKTLMVYGDAATRYVNSLV